MAIANAADIRPGQTIAIKSRKDQTIAQAPRWRVEDYEVIEVGDRVTSVSWTLSTVGDHAHKGGRPGETHVYTAAPYGRYTVDA